MEVVKVLGLNAKDFALDAAGKLKDRAKGMFSRFAGGEKEESADNSVPVTPPESSNAAQQGAAPQDPPDRFRSVTKCPNCRMPQNKPFEICPQCGVMVEKFLQRIEAESGAKEPASRSKIKTMIIAAGIVLVVVALIGGLKSLIGGKKSTSASQTTKTVSGQKNRVAQGPQAAAEPPDQGSTTPVVGSQDLPIAGMGEIWQDYQNNPVNADQKWRGKRFHLKKCSIGGPDFIQKTDKGFLLTLFQDGYRPLVWLLVPLAYEADVAQLKPGSVGEGITFEGTCLGQTKKGTVLFVDGRVVEERFNETCLALAQASEEVMSRCGLHFGEIAHNPMKYKPCLEEFAREYAQRDPRLSFGTVRFSLNTMLFLILNGKPPNQCRIGLLHQCESCMERKEGCGGN